MKKIAILLSFMMLLGLCACGSNSAPVAMPAAESTQELQPAQAPESEPETVNLSVYAEEGKYSLFLDGMSREDLLILQAEIAQKLASEDSSESNATEEQREAAPASDFLYVANAGTVIIRAYKGSSEKVVIPDSIDGAVVTTISESAFEANEAIMQIVLPDTIETISDSAFHSCKNLTDLQFPTKKLGEISIGKDAFSGCNISNPLVINAQSITLGPSCFSLNYDMPMILLLADSITMQDHPFSYCKSVKQVFMYPDTVASYDNYYLNSKSGDVFANMDNLEEVYLPRNCSFLTDNTFVKTPKAVVFSEENAPVLKLAESLWIPTNSSDYDTNVAKFYLYLENNGYSQ